jgi:hypothetical protein
MASLRSAKSPGGFRDCPWRFSGFGAPVNWIAADIVRLQDGILVEHWDVIQDEATQEQSCQCSVTNFHSERVNCADQRLRKTSINRI